MKTIYSEHISLANVAMDYIIDDPLEDMGIDVVTLSMLYRLHGQAGPAVIAVNREEDKSGAVLGRRLVRRLDL